MYDEIIPVNSEKGLFDDMPGSVYHCMNDQYFTIINANQEFFDMVGFSRVEIADRFQNRLLEMMHPFEREEVLAKSQKQLSDKNKCTCNYRILCRDGSYKWILDNSRLIRYACEEQTILGIMLDTTEIENTREEMELTLDRHRTIMNQTSDILFEWDIKNDKILSSSLWKEKFGYDMVFSKFENFETIAHVYHEDLPEAEKLVSDMHEGKSYSIAEFRIEDKDRKYLWCRVRVSNQCGEDGRPIKIIGLIQDIDEEKRLIENLRKRAERDALTGLYNRAETQKQIRKYLDDGPKEYCAMFMIDTDNFKIVNDSSGHLFGDAVLAEIAAGMKKIVRKSDVVGRIGGDEFTIFIKDIASAEAAKVLAQQFLEIFRHLFEEDKREFSISCSIGVAMYPRDGIDFQTLYECADKALYEAKSHGKDCYVIYDKAFSARDENTVYSTLGAAIDSDLRAADTLPENLVNYVFQILYDTADTDEAIRLLLEIVGKRFDVSRAYIYENTDDAAVCDNTYEWCNEGIFPAKHKQQQISYELLFKDSSVFYCRDIYKLSSPSLTEFFDRQDICSTLQCAMTEDNRFAGIIGFDECTGMRLWTKEEVGTLLRISQFLSTFLQKKRALERDHRIAVQLQNILDMQDAYIYVIDQKTFEMFYLNLKTKQLDHTAEQGMTCYAAFFGKTAPCANCPVFQKDLKEVYNPKYDIWTSVDTGALKWENKDAYLISCYDITAYIGDKKY